MAWETIRECLGWCALLNGTLLAMAMLKYGLLKDRVYESQGRLLGMDPLVMQQTVATYLATYKVVILAFNIVPYAALRMMGI